MNYYNQSYQPISLQIADYKKNFGSKYSRKYSRKQNWFIQTADFRVRLYRHKAITGNAENLNMVNSNRLEVINYKTNIHHLANKTFPQNTSPLGSIHTVLQC